MAITEPTIWPIATSSSTGQDISGSATPAGATILVPVTVRSDTASVTVTDNAGNTYTAVAATAGGADGALNTAQLFYCAGALSTTQITATADESVAIQLGALVFEGIDTSDPVDVEAAATNDPTGGSYPAVTVTPSAAGNLVVGLVGMPVSNRYLTQQDATYSDLTGSKSNQLALDVSYKVGAGTDPTGPQWDLTSGSPIGGNFLTVAFNAGEGGTPALSVDAGADQSIYVGQTASVSASASGGTGPYTYAWTKVSGPAGSFLNANQASTTFTPSGGAGTYVLRCIATDSTSTTAQDDVVVTVSQAPSLVTVASVGDATGWTPTGGTVLQVLSDTSDSTLVTSQENPTEQVLDVVMGPAVVAEGQHWTQRVRMRRSSSSTSGTATGYLYVGSTLISTVTGKTIPGTLGDVDFTFPNADVSAITGAQWTAGVRFVVEVTAA